MGKTRIPVTYTDDSRGFIECEDISDYKSPKQLEEERKQQEKLAIIKAREESRKRILREKAELKKKYNGHNKGYSVKGKKLGRPGKSDKEGVSSKSITTKKVIEQPFKKVVKRKKRRLKRTIRHKLKLMFSAFITLMVIQGINITYAWVEDNILKVDSTVIVAEAPNIVDEVKAEEVVFEEQKEEEVKPVNMACATSSAKTYMDYRAITNTSSKQYHYIKNYMTVGNDGYLRDSNGNIGVALGSHFGPIGSKYQVVLDTGITFNVVKIDEKADRHTYNGCQHRQDTSVIEFVVDSSKMKKASNGLVYSGNFNNNPEYKGSIEAMYKLD